MTLNTSTADKVTVEETVMVLLLFWMMLLIVLPACAIPLRRSKRKKTVPKN